MLFDASDQLQARYVLEFKIDERHERLVRTNPLEGGFPARHALRLKPLGAQDILQRAAEVGVIVDDENFQRPVRHL